MERTAWQREMNAVVKQRNSYLKKYASQRTFAPGLTEKVPENLRSTLNTAFVKAFQLIFEKGTPIIEKTYSKKEAGERHKINRFTAELKQNNKSYRLFSTESDKTNAVNLLFSGIEGISLGFLGCGIPDIPLFTAVILRSLYEISLNYGYDYTLPEEQYYLLLIIKGAMSYGNELKSCLCELDTYAETVVVPTKEETDELIKSTASALADEMLLLKFVQGIPIVGIVGGVSDTVFLYRIQKFAKINYQYRMLKSKSIIDNLL